MNHNRLVGIAVFVSGLIIFFLGMRATDAIGESTQRFAGHFTDMTTWLIVGGAVATVAGVGLALVGPRTRHA